MSQRFTALCASLTSFMCLLPFGVGAATARGVRVRTQPTSTQTWGIGTTCSVFRTMASRWRQNH